jgi:hypothetical protein
MKGMNRKRIQGRKEREYDSNYMGGMNTKKENK